MSAGKEILNIKNLNFSKKGRRQLSWFSIGNVSLKFFLKSATVGKVCILQWKSGS